MEIKNVVTFLKVSQMLNFTKAAEELGYSQGTVTVQIKQLEEELGVRLFERLGKSVFLSEKGAEFLPYASNLISAAREATSFVNKEAPAAGTLRIGSISSLSESVLPEILLKYHEKFPDVKTSIHISNYQFQLEMEDMVLRNDLDLIFYANEDTYLPNMTDVIKKKEKLVFVTYPSHPLAGEKAVPIDTVLKEPFILTTYGVRYFNNMDHFSLGQENEIHIKQESSYNLESIIPENACFNAPYLQVGEPAIITKMLMRGGGVSYLPFYAVKESLDKGHLALIDVDCPDNYLITFLSYHRNKWVTPQMEGFINLVKELYEP